MNFRSIFIVAAAVLAGLVWAQDDTDPDSGASVHKPLRFQTEIIPYEPERIIRMTLHDYVGARTCFADGAFNDYIAVRYIFDGSLLCQAEDIINAHLDLLRQSVVDEQTVKNEKWRDK